VLNSVTLPGSRMENITDIDTQSNVNNPGQFVFRIDDTVPPPGCNSTSGMHVQTHTYTHAYVHTYVHTYTTMYNV